MSPYGYQGALCVKEPAHISETKIPSQQLWACTFICYICLRPAAMSAMLVPGKQAGMHSCTRQSGSYVAVAPDQQSFLYVA